MNLKEARDSLLSFWNEFRRDRSGLIGLGILVMTLLLVVFEPLVVSFKEVNGRWRDINYWQDNSSAAPPAWTNLFSKTKKAVTTFNASPVVTEAEGENPLIRYEFSYDYHYDKAPLDLIVHGVGSGTFPVVLSLERPDGDVVELCQYVVEDAEEDDFRVSVNSDARDGAFEYARAKDSDEAVSMLDSSQASPTDVIFSVAGHGMLADKKPLKGEYKIVMQTMRISDEFKIEDTRLVVVGSVSGLLGTDTGKRDIFSGLIAGLKWALLIGLMTSMISVLIGVSYGIIAAYFGGTVDVVMNFVFELFISMPVLPILIVISAVFKPSIWFLIGALIVFSWVGPVKTVRSMALQIKEETYIEAARALGSGHWRIIFRHMMPILIPYSFASMALHVPGAIIYEASVSLLGLGDATMVTWGQILHDALAGGAVLNGLWWWVVPPGLLIAIMGMTFAFLGFAMDKILHPKLRTR